MDRFAGGTAVVTGAGSGIGLGLARSFARRGMNLVLCDIREDALAEAMASVADLGAKAIGAPVDVSDLASVEAMADKALATFGKIHVLCNNAGVSMHGTPIETLAMADWDWVVGVNVYGVINGFQVFLPHMRAHGEEGHIVNTASIGGLQMRAGWHGGAYSMTKYAVVALSEALEQDLADSKIGVSVLCPGSVRTGIFQSGRSRPQRFGGPAKRPDNEAFDSLLEEGLSPDEAGERVVDAIRAGEFFILTDSEPPAAFARRTERILKGFESFAKWRRGRAGNAGGGT